jgi:hypothetical protein
MTEKSEPFVEALEEFCREHIAPDLVQAAEPEPDRIIVDRDGQIVIQAGHDEWIGRDAEPFAIGDTHNLYEWAMVLGDKHPCTGLWYPGVEDPVRKDIRIAAIGLWPQTNKIAQALMAAYKAGKIKHVPENWDDEEPTDPTHLRFRRDDALEVISELGAEGEAIRMLMAEREQHASHQTEDAPAPEPATTKPLESPRKARAGRPCQYDSRPDVRALLEKARSDPKRGLDWLLRIRPRERREWLAKNIKKPLPGRTTLDGWINEYISDCR